ncbi:calmodulin-A-like isoform X2 [Ostrea edulis]|uniref:calmodulin-A-like isoform X2 n=1 Tax=Ostrea edulis TaxID=37623 RepID=UPI002094DDA0|nr:calmodulin-A-like isoform X2 [Ostrea edulis]
MSSKKTVDRKLEAEIQSLFKTFDKNNDKYLSKEELGKAMRILGLDVTRGDVLEAMKVLDKNGNGRIEYKEFSAFMKKELAKKPSEADKEASIRAAFKIFDRDGNGLIDGKELKYAMQNLGEKLTDKELADMMKEADTDKDGKIDYEEFVQIWKDSM